jgi:hypothetical protein
MPKLIRDNEGTYLMWCPGCKFYHGLAVDKPSENGSRWSFDGNMEQPTFSPSLLVKVQFTDPSMKTKVCHSFIRAGKIQFLTDCTHHLAGQTVDLPDIDM